MKSKQEFSRHPHDAPPSQVDGDYHYDSRRASLLWQIELMDDTNRSGSMEFVVSPGAPAEAFFPVDVTFDAGRTLCEISVAGVTDVDSGAPVKYGMRCALVADGYQVA